MFKSILIAVVALVQLSIAFPYVGKVYEMKLNNDDVANIIQPFHVANGEEE
jgi:hypothetical protein